MMKINMLLNKAKNVSIKKVVFFECKIIHVPSKIQIISLLKKPHKGKRN
jgi:hypothetical protein